MDTSEYITRRAARERYPKTHSRTLQRWTASGLLRHYYEPAAAGQIGQVMLHAADLQQLATTSGRTLPPAPAGASRRSSAG